MGPDHISTLDTVNVLGLIYAKQGKPDEAEKIYQRACKDTRRHWLLTTLLKIGIILTMIFFERTLLRGRVGQSNASNMCNMR